MPSKPGLKTQVAVLEMGKKTCPLSETLNCGISQMQLQGFGLALFQVEAMGFEERNSRHEFTIPCNVEVDNSWTIPLEMVPQVRNHLRSSCLQQLSLGEGGKVPLVGTDSDPALVLNSCKGRPGMTPIPCCASRMLLMEGRKR